MDSSAIVAALKRHRVPHERIAAAINRDRTAATKMLNGTRSIKAAEIAPLLALIREFDGEDITNSPDVPEDRRDDDVVYVELLPTHAGMGGGGTGDGDAGTVAFSRALIESELRGKAETFLAVFAEGNSMEPDFRDGDLILVDTRRKSLASPGAFCLWASDGYVIKFVERVDGSDPPMLRLVSLRSDLYPPIERLAEQCDIRGRVAWFGRRYR